MFGGRKKKSSTADLAKESAIKTQILDDLKESVKVLQHENKNNTAPLLLNESTARFCSVLEAIFLHGLKETFLGRLSRWGGGELSPRLPQPSFWTFALVFSHKQVISAVEKYSQINSEVGRSRAWLRLALNDGLLESYLAPMSQDKVSLSVHYESYAFLRDSEKMDLVVRYISGIQVLSFSLPTNVSMLNRWLPEPLVMAGLWTSTLQPLTDMAAVDAAELAEETQPQPIFIRNLSQPVTNQSFVQLGLINEDEALRLILQSTPVSLPTTPEPLSRNLSPSPSNLRSYSSSRASSPAPGSHSSRAQSPVSRGVSPGPVSAGQTTMLTQVLRGTTVVHPEALTRLVHGHDNYEAVPELEPEKQRKSPEPAKDEQDLDFYNTTQPKFDLDQPEFYEAQDQGEEKVPHSTEAGSTQDEPCLPPPDPDIREGSAESQISSGDIVSTPSMEWDEERTVPAPGGVNIERDDILLQEGPKHSTPEPDLEQDSVDSNDSSCTCSTEGPRASCTQCSNASPKTRVSLSEFVEPDPSSLDLIGLDGERNKRKLIHKIGFRSKPVVSLPEFALHRNLELVSCLDIIPRELGLDTQDWRCIDCTKAIGALFGNGKVCSFTKKHYCEDCHEDDLSIIPPRLIYNWDAKLYPVSKSSLRFINQVKTMPVIHLRTFNPALSEFVPSLEKYKRRRKQLIYLLAYISACPRAEEGNLRSKLMDVLEKREYLLQDTETFSIQDLVEIQAGELDGMMQRGVLFCMVHVDSCLICAGRGFICEICEDKRPVYPFNLDSTSQCQDCCTVFHSSCALTLQECPRCERIAARSLNLLVTQSKLRRAVVET